MKRRKFLTTASGLAAASVGGLGSRLVANEPFTRNGPARFYVGLAAYSLRGYFSFMKGKERKPDSDGKPIDMVGFLDYCVAGGFDSAELTSYFFKPDADAAYFAELRRQAFIRGITIAGTAIGNNFTVGKGDKLDQQIASAITWIDNAATLGAPHIRFFAGTAKQLASNPDRLDESAAAINQCAAHAATKGVFLGIENHGQLSADQMIEIMKRIDSPWVGINLDTGNFISDDPYRDLERCVGYAVNVQVKVSMKSPEGKKLPADLQRIAKILKDGGYQGHVILEYEDEKPYENIPDAHKKLRDALGA